MLEYEKAGSVKGEGRLAPKTSRNVWVSLTTAMKYASTRRGPRELRAREDKGNPCLGIPPPRDGVSKHRQWCRPGEIFAVLDSADVPLAWREAIAIGCYLHLRPGEIHELRISDLDLDAGEVKIRPAYDEREKVVKTPKTEEGIRHITIRRRCFRYSVASNASALRTISSRPSCRPPPRRTARASSAVSYAPLP